MKSYRALLAALAVMLAAGACSAEKLTAPNPDRPSYESGYMGSGGGRIASEPGAVQQEP